MRISCDKGYFKKDGADFFYLADTVWSAFTNIEYDDWIQYLDKRKAQGFNVLQINALPQWDRSISGETLHPFYIDKEKSEYVVSEINPAYFDNARRMLSAARERGFAVALVLLWCSFVPGTWADTINRSVLINRKDLDFYIKTIHHYFADFEPIYFVSGDTKFENDAVTDYYLETLNILSSIAPDNVTTLHLASNLTALPDVIQKHPHLSFYCYQSGHFLESADQTYTMAEAFFNKAPAKPILNAEPCYEMMGYIKNAGDKARNTRFDVRKAAWQSVLSGASAGITYGAHGIWSWHHSHSIFGVGYGPGSEAYFLPPYDWNVALQFPGADDYSYLKEVLTDHDFLGARPYNGLLRASTSIRAASKNGKTIIYLPYNDRVNFKEKIVSSSILVIDLESKMESHIHCEMINGLTSLPMHPFHGDVIYIISPE